MEFNSINDFKKNFYEVYHKEVVPTLRTIDVERLQTRKKAFSYTAIVMVIAIIIFIVGLFKSQVSDFFITVGFIIFFSSFVIYSSMAKNFETKLKIRIMPLLMKSFGNFSWKTSPVINTEELRASKIFSRFDHRDIDDNFTGTYSGMPIEISETELYYYTTDSKGRKHRHTVFKGVVVSIVVGKNFTGHTIVRQRRFLGNNKCYNEVKLEDPEFSKMFFVDSNDQIESRYILTTAFMERFKRISNAFGSKHPECSFKFGKIMIALSTNKDLFKLGDLNTPVTETKQFQIFLDELIAIFEMIEHLKVTQRTGL